MKPETIVALESGAHSALGFFGVRAQMIKTCEELAELTQVLCKNLNEAPCSDEYVQDEIADVLIMAHQMRIIFGEKAVDDRVIYKLNRTMEYVRKSGRVKELDL